MTQIKEPEKYFICPICAELITWTEILENCSNGGSGDCTCLFCDLQWNSKEQYFEPIYWREVTLYQEIPQKIYDMLKTVKNDVKRREMYRSWENSQPKI
jgi:hypothetical protein